MNSGNCVEINKVSILKEKLENAPEKERIFFLQIGSIANELTALSKLSSCCAKTMDSLDEKSIEQTALSFQSLFLIKLLMGKLYEGWTILEKVFLEKLSVKYESKLNDEAKLALEKLRNYFNGPDSEIRSSIRNRFSFHYGSSQDIKKIFAQIPPTEDWSIYLGAKNGNCFYHISEIVENYAMLETVQSGDPQKALDKIIVQSIEVTGYFSCFISEFMYVFLQEYAGQNIEMERIQVKCLSNDLPQIPYFIVMPDDLKKI